MPEWAQWVVGAGATVTALAALGRYVGRPLVRFTNDQDDVMPRMRRMAQDFPEDGQLRRELDEVRALAAEALAIAQRAHDAAERLSRRIKDRP